MQIQARHLELVEAVSRHRSMGAAARALGTSQPAVTAQIRRIENELGAVLFDRCRSGAVPTAAGTTLVEGWRSISAGLEELFTRVRAESGADVLRFGCNYSSVAVDMLPALEQAWPGRTVIPHVDASSTRQHELLLSGQVAATLVSVHPQYDAPVPPGFREEVVIPREGTVVALASDHRLADRAEVDLADLGEEAWLLPPGEPDGTLTALQRAFAAAGIKPRTPLGSVDLIDFWPYVAAGRAVSVCLDHARNPDTVVFRPLAGTPIATRRVLRWNPKLLSDGAADTLLALSVDYLDARTREACERNGFARGPHDPA